MDSALLASLAGLALADSLNPFTVAAQAYLLGTRDPMPRSIAFLVGTFLTYFLGGVLLLRGLTYVIERIWPLVPWWGLGTGEVALGLLLLHFAWYTGRKAAKGEAFKPPADLGFSRGSSVPDSSR